jgi:outer membrane lipoprotein-sorting protein
MFRLAFAAAALAALATGAPTVTAGDEAKTTIAKAIEAQGGQALLKKYQATTAKFKGKIHTEFGDGDMAGTIQTQGNDKFRFQMNMTLGGAEMFIVSVVDPKNVWFTFNGSPQEIGKDAEAESREQMYVGRVADLRNLDDKDVRLTALGESKVGDKPAVGVRVSRAGHRDVSLFFDKEKGLLLTSETKVKDPTSGAEFTEVKFYRDYKNVSGVAVPHKIEAKRDGKPHAETEVTEITLSEKLPDSTFAKP